MNLLVCEHVYISETGFNNSYSKGGENVDEFEKLLKTEQASVERFLKFRIDSKSDVEDILQEVYLTAYQKFYQLKNKDSFKAWIIGIARNKCNDYYRKRMLNLEISIDEITESELSDGRYGISVVDTVSDTLKLLNDKDKQILHLYFWKKLPQAVISKKLNIPVGTVKSRLYTAKQNFKTKYPYNAVISKGDCNMRKLPEFIPEYKIEPSAKTPFCVKWEELMGWFIIPKLGEKVSWGLYDIPSRKCIHVYDMQVTGKAKVHGIEGVEIIAREASYSERTEVVNRTFVAQLTETHCRYLATFRNDGDVHNYITFLDGDEFMTNWGFGEDNCGNEINLSAKGDINRTGNIVTSINKEYLLDIVGRYNVSIGGKTYDTVCVMDIESPICDVVLEHFLDKNGKTILSRRYNRNDWAIERYKQPWCEQLPENDRLIVNGATYVHWDDCITEYII